MTLSGTHLRIVGRTRSIGRATAEAALAAGARVTVTGRSVESLATVPDGATGALLDFTDTASVEALAEGVTGLDHLVLSASDAVAWGPFAEVSKAALRAAFDAKFWGYWRVVRALAPRLSAHGPVTLVTGAAARTWRAGP